jgi:hypothetical protein
MVGAGDPAAAVLAMPQTVEHPAPPLHQLLILTLSQIVPTALGSAVEMGLCYLQ